MQKQKLGLAFVLLGLVALVACGGGNTVPPVPPVFSSVPVTAAEQSVQYTYQLQASASGAPVTFALTVAPAGAALNGNTITWTPTPAQARVPNSFTVTANAGGASSTQSWSVTPTGTIIVNWIDTYFTGNGPVTVPNVFPSNNSFPAALVPQSDGSLATLSGSAVSAGVFAIPNVPAGHFWLEIGPGGIFWTSASTFDFGSDLVGSPPPLTNTPNTTIVSGNFSNLDPIQARNWFGLVTDLHSFDLDSAIPGAAVGATTYAPSFSIGSDLDYSRINTFFAAQYEVATPAGLQALVMGPALALSNLTLTTGGTNNVGGSLIPSPVTSMNLNIQGSAWADVTANVAPAAPTPLGSALILSAQPFVTDRNALPMNTFLGPNLPLIAPEQPTTGPLGGVTCNQAVSGILMLSPTTPPLFDQPPIVTDQNFGMVQYGDPFPAAWPRVFNFCQGFTEQVPIPNSSSTQPFVLQNGEASGIPTSTVVPLLSGVQNPKINGASLFVPATLHTGTVTLSWDPPATGTPFGYFIQEFSAITSNGTTAYSPGNKFGVAVNSITLPPLPAATTVVFMISAVADGKANMETSPRRSALPVAYADVLSAPITINP